jgi:hypothetical protein
MDLAPGRQAHVWSTEYNRMREGTGFKYLKDKLRFSGEYMRGAGMIYNGPNPPFVDIPTDSTGT